MIYRLLVAWYRLLGRSEVQAQWRARELVGDPEAEGAAADDGAARPQRRGPPRRFVCICGHLVLDDDKRCPGCGRRQILPYGVRIALRRMGMGATGAAPATMGMGALMIAGYAIQALTPPGGLFSPSGGLELLELGASWGPLTLGPQWWRSVTYLFVHGGLLHIAFNTFALAQVGPLVELRFGTGRTLFAFVASGAFAVIAPTWLGIDARAPVVGASGAVFGLIGMALLRGHLDGDSRGRMIRDIMIKWTLYITILGMVIGGVAHGAHFGGLAAGLALSLLLPPPDGDRRRALLGPALGAAAIVGVVAALVTFGAWYAGPRRPPAAAGEGLQVEWALAVAELRGTDAALDHDGRALLAEAARVRALPDGDPRVDDFLRRRRAWLDRADAGQRAVAARALREIFDPGRQ